MKNHLLLLMEENLAWVWSERDAASRIESIKTFYTTDSTLNHVGHQVIGYDAINESIHKVLADMPAEFTFFKLKPVIINNNIGRLIWGIGPDIKSIVATGTDIAVFEGGKIKSLYVFLD